MSARLCSKLLEGIATIDMHKNKKSVKSQSQSQTSTKTHSKPHTKTHTKPKFRSFLSTKINFLGQATIFCTIFCLFFFFFTYFLSNLAIAEKIIDFLSYVIISSFFAALLFATLTFFYYLLKLLKKLYKKPRTIKARQRLYQSVKNYFHRLQQKIKAMDKRPIIAVFIILFSLAIWLLPAFIYNELEVAFRQRGSLTEAYFIGADEGIYIRQQGGASSYYDTLFSVGDAVEELIKSGLEELEIAQEYNKKQRFWLIFLGKEYKDYHQAKTASVERYYQSYQQFLTQKEQEHLRNNILYSLGKLNEDLPEMLGLDYDEQELANIPKRIAEIENKRQQLLEQELIDETINQYYQSELEFFLAFYRELEKFHNSGDIADFDLSVYQQRQRFGEELDTSFRQKLAELSQRADQIVAEMHESENEMFKVIVNYIKDGLNLDPLSKLLAKISDDFPRIRMTEEAIKAFEQSLEQKEGEEGEEGVEEPVKAPFGVIGELVG